ncbi:MAG: SDR family oxidoreductase [Bdellovibrio sp.]|nr:SDR family oxidoreductase [Bdellovibrio sp.]
MIAVTGANGKLGHHVIKELLKRTDAKNIIAVVRNPEKAADLKALGVEVRKGDYDQYESLVTAFEGVQKVVLISSSEVGKRQAQHANAVKAAKQAGIKLLAYTSILRADTSVLGLAKEHLATENEIKASGIPYTFLRNGWYLENHTENLASALQFGQMIGAAGEGRFSSASRQDYATAAAVVVTQAGHEGKIYELAGDNTFTMAELAKEVGHQANKTITYQDMTEADYEKALVGFGLPQAFAHLLADSDTGAKKGDLFSSSKDLSRLIGHETTTLASAVKSAL